MRRIVNILIYPLTGLQEKKYLISSQEIIELNSNEICKIINNTIILLARDKIDYNKLLVLITDSTSYMKKAYKVIK